MIDPSMIEPSEIRQLQQDNEALQKQVESLKQQIAALVKITNEKQDNLDALAKEMIRVSELVQMQLDEQNKKMVYGFNQVVASLYEAANYLTNHIEILRY